MYTYLMLNIGTLAGPLLLSFDRKVAFYRQWRALFPAIAFTAVAFIIWDIIFTEQGVWSFNPEFLVGIQLLGLPLEEWLFFLTVPYACMFIYECLNAYITRDILKNVAKPLTWTLIGILLVLAAIHWGRTYTVVTFIWLGVWLLLNQFWIKGTYMGRFFLSYFICLIPFLLVNGVLTALPVVIYNDMENLSFRIGTIPVEDTMYALLLLLMNVNIYEYLKTRLNPKPHEV